MCLHRLPTKKWNGWQGVIFIFKVKSLLSVTIHSSECQTLPPLILTLYRISCPLGAKKLTQFWLRPKAALCYIIDIRRYFWQTFDAIRNYKIWLAKSFASSKLFSRIACNLSDLIPYIFCPFSIILSMTWVSSFCRMQETIETGAGHSYTWS